MRSVVAYPGNMLHAQQIARALYDAAQLDAYVTTFVWRPDGEIARVLRRLPLAVARRAQRQFERRAIREIPGQLVDGRAGWELARTASSLFIRNPVATDLIWDRMSHAFDADVAQRWVSRTEAIHAFEYTALAAFERARELGKARVLHLPSLDSREFEQIKRREIEALPELRSPHDAYFNAKFERRYDRRRREIALADLIIANSSLTARSHISAGADPAKVVAVPLAAPPTIDQIIEAPGRSDRPLRLVWAGSFSLRKGAHYLLQAWRRLAAGAHAELHVYGRNLLPDRLLCEGVDGITMHGSVPQPQLYEAFEACDALVFPTLSDGFGMIVTEAFAHGLPVITTDRAGAADLITPQSGFIVPAADPSALVDAMRWCLDNRRQLFDMRAGVLAAARARQWSHYRSELLMALNDGLSRAGFRPSFEAA